MKKHAIYVMAAMVTLLLASGVAQARDEDVFVKMKVAGGGTYDYVVLGLRADATDGYDPAFESFAPMPGSNDSFIEVYIPHPEWARIKSKYRSEVKSLRGDWRWRVNVETNLAAGTLLSMESEGAVEGIRVLLVDHITGGTVDITDGAYEYVVPANGGARPFTVALVKEGKPGQSGDAALWPYEVTGVVRDASGNPLAGVEVEIDGNHIHKKTVSGPGGEYVFIGMGPGDYRVKARKRSYRFGRDSITIASGHVSYDIVEQTRNTRR